jgi:hypothetical protein
MFSDWVAVACVLTHTCCRLYFYALEHLVLFCIGAKIQSDVLVSVPHYNFQSQLSHGNEIQTT